MILEEKGENYEKKTEMISVVKCWLNFVPIRSIIKSFNGNEGEKL